MAFTSNNHSHTYTHTFVMTTELQIEHMDVNGAENNLGDDKVVENADINAKNKKVKRSAATQPVPFQRRSPWHRAVRMSDMQMN